MPFGLIAASRTRRSAALGWQRLVACAGELLHAVVPAGLRIAAKPVPLADVERAWAEDDSTARTVLTLD